MSHIFRRVAPTAARWGATATRGRRHMSAAKATPDPMTGELTALPDINVGVL